MSSIFTLAFIWVREVVQWEKRGISWGDTRFLQTSQILDLGVTLDLELASQRFI